MKRLIFALFVLVFQSLALLVPSEVEGYYTNMPASVVIGQPDFVSNALNQGATAGANTLGVAHGFLLVNNKLIVVDRTNHRVLVYNSIPTTNNASASVVIGQQDFISVSANQGGSVSANTLNVPVGVCSDGTRIIVPDLANHRVLVYNSIPTTNNAPADVVIGQTSFTLNSPNTGGRTAKTLNSPRGCFVDKNGKLYIGDRVNRRVLIFNQIPTTNNASADVVIGQSDFTTADENQGGLGANTLSFPEGVYSDGQRLFIGDLTNNRVLVFNSIPTTNKPSADVVIGQPDFTSNSANQGGGAMANTFSNPRGVWVDNGRVYISDHLNNRVLVFNQIPTTNNASADIVIGQPSFTSNSANQGGSVGANTMDIPNIHGVYIVENKLIVGDGGNNRVLIFSNVITTPGMNINSDIESLSDGRLKVKGDVLLGERDRYSMQRVQASVNGESFSEVTSLDGGRDGGVGETIYDFTHEFSPWVSIPGVDISSWNPDIGYTLKLKASSFNADDSLLFFFQPFNLISASGNTFSFSVGKNHIQRIKDNIEKFEIHVKKAGSSEWTKFLGNISTSLIDSEGNVSVSPVTKGVRVMHSIPSGEYEVSLKAISKNSDWSFSSNSLTNASIAGAKFTNENIDPDLTLQINSITGAKTGVLSSFNPLAISTNYNITTASPVIKGISWVGSTITLTVANADNAAQERMFTTTVDTDSSFSLTPSLYKNSFINISTQNPFTGKFNQLPSFAMTVN